MTQTQVKSPFKVEVSPDRLQATIRLVDGADPQQMTTQEVVAALGAVKVAVTDLVTSRVEEYVKNLLAGNNPHAPVVIATGKAAQEGQDGRFEWDEEIAIRLHHQNNEATLDYHNVCTIVLVSAGDRIGRAIPPNAGIPGVDVHFNEIRLKEALRKVTLKNNVALMDDGVTVTATTPGKVDFDPKSLTLSVVEVLEIAGDVDFSVGNVDSPTNVSVRGNIKDMFRVKTLKSLSVGGAIEAAEIEAGENVEVRGGILNRSKGHVRAKGAIKAKFCDEANLHAVGDIIITREVLNSHIHTESKLLIPNGAVIGGSVYGRIGVEVKVLGSDACIPTAVGVGTSEQLLREAMQAKVEHARHRATVEKIRQTVQPLLVHAKSMSRAQKELATELMGQADSLEAKIHKSEECFREIMAAMAAAPDETSKDTGPCVLVGLKVCQGVSVRIHDRITTFMTEAKGPIRICRRKIKNHTVVAAVNPLTGSVIELNSHRVEFDDAGGE